MQYIPRCTIIEAVDLGVPLLNRLREYTEYGTIGIAWVAGTVVYIYIFRWVGQWLDQRLGTEPIFLVLGLIAAVGLSFWWLIDRLTSIERSRLAAKRRQADEVNDAQDRERDNNPRARKE